MWNDHNSQIFVEEATNYLPAGNRVPQTSLECALRSREYYMLHGTCFMAAWQHGILALGFTARMLELVARRFLDAGHDARCHSPCAEYVHPLMRPRQRRWRVTVYHLRYSNAPNVIGVGILHSIYFCQPEVYAPRGIYFAGRARGQTTGPLTCTLVPEAALIGPT